MARIKSIVKLLKGRMQLNLMSVLVVWFGAPITALKTESSLNLHGFGAGPLTVRVNVEAPKIQDYRHMRIVFRKYQLYELCLRIK